MFADLSTLDQEPVIQPAVTTFLESLEIAFIGSQQENGYDNTTVILDILQHARHQSMPPVQWAGFNRAFPLTQGVSFDMWKKGEIQILRNTFEQFQGRRKVDKAIQSQLKTAGFERTLHAIDRKRRDLGLKVTSEASAAAKASRTAEIKKALEGAIRNSLGRTLEQTAQEMAESLQAQGIEHDESLCQQAIRLAAPHIKPSSLVRRGPWSGQEKDTANTVREDEVDKSDHTGMAKLLRDKLGGNRTLEDCKSHLDETFPQDLRRTGSWVQWEKDAAKSIMESNPELGARRLATVLEQHIKTEYGEHMVRGPTAYVAHFKSLCKKRSGADALGCPSVVPSVVSEFIGGEPQDLSGATVLAPEQPAAGKWSIPEVAALEQPVDEQTDAGVPDDQRTKSTAEAWSRILKDPFSNFSTSAKKKRSTTKQALKRTTESLEVWAGAGFTKRPKLQEE